MREKVFWWILPFVLAFAVCPGRANELTADVGWEALDWADVGADRTAKDAAVAAVVDAAVARAQAAECQSDCDPESGLPQVVADKASRAEKGVQCLTPDVAKVAARSAFFDAVLPIPAQRRSTRRDSLDLDLVEAHAVAMATYAYYCVDMDRLLRVAVVAESAARRAARRARALAADVTRALATAQGSTVGT